MATVEQDHRERARRAIEEVCARGDFDKAPQFYSERFHDHVNSLEYRGLDGVRQSVELYRSIFPDLELKVEEQLVQGDRVALALDRAWEQPRPASRDEGNHHQPAATEVQPEDLQDPLTPSASPTATRPGRVTSAPTAKQASRSRAIVRRTPRSRSMPPGWGRTVITQRSIRIPTSI